MKKKTKGMGLKMIPFGARTKNNQSGLTKKKKESNFKISVNFKGQNKISRH